MNYRTFTTLATFFALGAGAFAGCAAEETSPSGPSSAGPVTGNNTTNVTSNGPTNTTTVSNTSATSSTASTTGSSTTGNAAVTSTTGGATGSSTTGGATITSTATTGAATSTSGSSCAGTPAAGPVALAPMNGFVSCSSNTVGVEGYFYTFDDGTSTITPADFSAAGMEICASGTAETADEDFTVWGAGVGFNLADEATWDATAAGISGVSFTVTGMLPTNFRFIVTEPGDKGYCYNVTSESNTVTFAETNSACWDDSGTAPNPANLVAIQWQVSTSMDGPQDFNFCITNIQLLP